MERNCPKCCTSCNDKAEICHACSYAFSKSKRIWRRVLNIASVSSLFIGLSVVVFNQSTQLIEKIKPTEFAWLGIKTAQGSNRLISENYTFSINSGTAVLLERLIFSGSEDSSKLLKMGVIHGKTYTSSNIVSIRVNPTAIHSSSKPAPFEMIGMFLENGIPEDKIPYFFKIRPSHSDNKIYKKYPWAVISGRVSIDYFEPMRDLTKRLTKEYPSPLLLWVRKADNLKGVLKSNYPSIDADSFIKKYNEVFKKHGKTHNK